MKTSRRDPSRFWNGLPFNTATCSVIASFSSASPTNLRLRRIAPIAFAPNRTTFSACPLSLGLRTRAGITTVP